MLLETFRSANLVLHLQFLAQELLGAWSISSSCSSRAEQWLHDLVQSETITLQKLSNEQQNINYTAAEAMLSLSRALLDARLYDRASRMLTAAQLVSSTSINSLHRALQGRVLLSAAVTAAAADSSHSAACQVQQAMDCFQTGLALDDHGSCVELNSQLCGH